MNQTTRQPRRPVARWLPAAAAAGLIGTVVLAGVALGGEGDNGTPVAEPTAGSTFTPVSVAAPDPSVAPTVATTVPEQKSELARTLTRGVAGTDVEEVQQRLTDLGFVPGPIDGIFGDETIRAVWAYQKLLLGAPSEAPSGEVTPEMWTAMQEPEAAVTPRRPHATTNHTEVYLPEQVVAVFHDDVPMIVTHMSSGTGDEWCEEVTISPGEYGNRDGEEDLKRGECGRSNTPGGVYEYYRQVEGIRESALGSMWNPVYFNYGIAIHGALNVPLQPASHGCIRIPMNISERLQSLIAMGDQVFVWDGEKEPEDYGDQPPTFNWLDPDYVTTTTPTVVETTVPDAPPVEAPVDTAPAPTDAATTVAADPTPAPAATESATGSATTAPPSSTTTTTVPESTSTATVPDSGD